MSGKITDARNLPIVGAVITARGKVVGWTATVGDGAYHLSLPAGSYEILVRKGGYTPSAASVVLSAGAVLVRSLVLAEANLSSVNLNSLRSAADVPFTTDASATATLAHAAISQRPELSLRELALELPGITLAHPAASVPDTSFVARGGTDETRVQIDGHGVSAGATGRWNSSIASQPLFDSIEVVKGAGLSGANAGQSAFGTVNLRTRDFAPGRQADVVLGTDSYGGNFSTFVFTGNAFHDDRLSYIFEHNLYGYNGPQAGRTVNNAVAITNRTALLVDRNALNSPLMLGSDLAKLRWRFTSNTSLTVGFIGMHSEYFESGGAYGEFLADRTILPFAPGAVGGGTLYSSPQYPGLIGKTVSAYTFAHNTSVQTNQPLFEAELRTAIKNDTLLIRPYVATIYNVTDGSGRSDGADPGSGGWVQVTSGRGCSVRSPCLLPNSSFPNANNAGIDASFRNEEVDRLHGTTVTLIHPLAAASLNLSYDYHSDETAVTTGNPTVRFNGTFPSLNAYLPIIPTTLARTFDWSATYAVPLTRRLRLFAGDYYTDWKLRYGAIVNVFDFSTNAATQTLTSGVRNYRHDDPHLGLTWRPQSDTAFRLTAGSAITVPYAQLVAGGQGASGAFTGSGVLLERNPALQPESTVAYDFGFDHRFQNGTVLGVDAFDNTIHQVFATQVARFDGAATLGLPPNSPYNAAFATTTKPVNAPLERNYGLELSLAHAPPTGLGYRLAATLQRAFLDQLPPSFYLAPTSLVNQKQLDGSTSIPYTHVYGELNLRSRLGIVASMGADYTGTNNWTNGPAFTLWSTMLRYDLRNGYRAQFSIENLFDHNTGTQYAAGVANGGFASVNYGARAIAGLPTFGASPTTRFAIAPRTFRFQVEAHVGY